DPRPTPLAEFAVLAPGGQAAVRPGSFHRADTPAEFVVPATGKRISRFDPPETGDTVVISRGDYRGGPFRGDGRRFVRFRRGKRGRGGKREDWARGVWEVATGRRVAQGREGKALATAAAVSPDGKAVVVLSIKAAPPRLAVWEPDTGRTRWARDLGRGLPFI